MVPDNVNVSLTARYVVTGVWIVITLSVLVNEDTSIKSVAILTLFGIYHVPDDGFNTASDVIKISTSRLYSILNRNFYDAGFPLDL